MNAFFYRPKVQKTLRYLQAYGWFVLFTVLGLVITEISRSNLLGWCNLLNVDRDTIYLLITWGSYLLYLPYILSIAILEEYMHAAAKTSQVPRRAANVAVIEGAIGLLTILTYILFIALRLPALI